MAEVTETVVYQLPLDVTDPDDKDSLLSAWLCVEAEEADEHRVSTAHEIVVLRRPDADVDHLEEILAQINDLAAAVRTLLSFHKVY